MVELLLTIVGYIGTGGATLWFQNLVKSIVEIATTSGWASRSIAASACGLVIKTAEGQLKDQVLTR
jgi:hypothetical protein